MNVRHRFACALVAALALAGFCIPDAAVLTETEMIDHLVQSRCPDGRPPIECSDARQQVTTDAMHWRKHDYPATGDGAGGYQITDTVITPDRSYIVAAFSFHPFTKFNAAIGDGGETIRIDGGVARSLATQDGGTPGMQYFCGGSGWVLFDSTIPTGSWRTTLAKLNIKHDAGAVCPTNLNPALTRWRREMLTVPFTIFGVRKNLTQSCIIYEHFNGATIAGAADMEQGVWCKGWGRIWFGFYSTGSAPASLASRLPGRPWQAPPERPDFVLKDARLYTDVRAESTPNCRQADFGWPPVGYRP